MDKEKSSEIIIPRSHILVQSIIICVQTSRSMWEPFYEGSKTKMLRTEELINELLLLMEGLLSESEVEREVDICMFQFSDDVQKILDWRLLSDFHGSLQCGGEYIRLAYHIHMLLLGCSPFSEKPTSVIGGKSIPVVHAGHDLAVTANYCYTNLRSNAELPAYCPSFDVITPELQKLFQRAFEDGASDPTKRPRPEEFQKAIEEYVNGLRYCNCENAFDHYLYKSYSKDYCEWCRIDKENHATKRIDKGDINYMTNKELQHMCELSFVSNDLKAMAYLELALRHLGKAKIMIDGNMPIPSVVDKRKAQELSKKAYAVAESSKLKDFAKRMMST